MIGFGLYQSCRNRGTVCLYLGCGGVCGVGGGWLGPESGRVGWSYVCVCCKSGFFLEIAYPAICVLCSADT